MKSLPKVGSFNGKVTLWSLASGFYLNFNFHIYNMGLLCRMLLWGYLEWGIRESRIHKLMPWLLPFPLFLSLSISLLSLSLWFNPFTFCWGYYYYLISDSDHFLEWRVLMKTKSWLNATSSCVNCQHLHAFWVREEHCICREGHTKVKNESNSELMNHGREVKIKMQLLDLVAKLLKAER